MFAKALALLIGLCLSLGVKAQISNPAVMDTTDIKLPGKVIIGAYVDAYYNYNLNASQGQPQAYGVSFDRDNEFAINLAYIDVKYVGPNVRARLVPGFGSYMSANYGQEPIQYRNILEASIGFKPFNSRDIWIDAGVIGSPYTNESAISRDHLMLTRSLSAEYVPYYLSGIKASAPLSSQVILSLYVLNGWQNIQETNKQKSFGTQVEYRPSDKWLINWNTYIGYEASILTPLFRGRYFSDIYFVYNPNGRFSATGCIYGGIQQKADSLTGETNQTTYWYCANLIGRYRFTPSVSLSGRIERLADPEGVVSYNLNQVIGAGLDTYSGGLCLNYKPSGLLLLRLEAKQYFGGSKPFNDPEGNPISTNTLLVAGANIIF